jgi:hypothetical protein
VSQKKEAIEDERLLSLLEDTCLRLGVSVRYERLEGTDTPIQDGFCRIKGQDFVFIDRRRTVGEKIRVLVEAVGRMDVEAAYLPPVVRELIKETRARQHA